MFSTDFGYILGVLFGDGFITTDHLGLSVRDKDFALEFKRVFENEFKKEGKLHCYSADRKIEICNTNYKLLLFCKNLLEELNISTRKIDKRIRGTREINGRILKPFTFYRFTLSEGKDNFIKFKQMVGFSIERKRKKLEGLINSYLPTKSKWGLLRLEVLRDRKVMKYTELRNKYKYLPKSTIDRWLYKY